MIHYLEEIQDRFREYSNVNAKVKAEVDAGRLFRLKKGVYSDSVKENLFVCANAIVRPSYVSFLSALAYYDLIPERVVTVMNAVTKVGKTREFENPLGRFLYQNVPLDVFSFGIADAPGGFQIASPEKALADTLYWAPPQRTLKGLKEFMFEDLRLDEEDIAALNEQYLRRILPLYRCTNANLMLKFMEELHGK